MRDDREDEELLEEEETSVTGVKSLFRKKNNREGDEEEQEKTGIHFSVIRKMIIIVVILVVAYFLITKLFPGMNYNGYEVVEETGITNASMVDYVPYQKSILKYSRDGATYVDEKGEAIWTETFAMKMPAADVCGDYVAIADLNGNDVYVFDKEGKVSSTTMPYTISDIAVARQGEFAVILEGEKENYINLYDRKGSQIMERKTAIDQNGYPLDMDLSANGEKLFSSYLAINEAGKLESKLTASNFGEVGQNENADRMVGAYQLDDTIVPKVEFLDDNTICAFGDNQFLIFSMREKSSKKATISFKEEIQSVIYNSQYVGVVMLNDDEKSEAPYVLYLYNMNGHEVLKKEIDIDYKKVKMTEDEIIFTGGNQARIYTMDGKVKFSCTFSKNVNDMIPTGYSKRYIVLYESGSEVVRLCHKSEKEKS